MTCTVWYVFQSMPMQHSETGVGQTSIPEAAFLDILSVPEGPKTREDTEWHAMYADPEPTDEERRVGREKGNMAVQIALLDQECVRRGTGLACTLYPPRVWL